MNGAMKSVNGGAFFRWSFGRLSAWGRIDSTTILITHPSLVKNTDIWSSFSSNTFMIKSDMSFFFQLAQEITNEFIINFSSEFFKNHQNGRNTTNGKCTF